MDATKALEELTKLRAESSSADVLDGATAFTSWKARAKTVLIQALGREHHLVESFDGIRYTLSVWTTSTPQSAYANARKRGLERAAGVLDAAIYEVELSAPSEVALPPPSQIDTSAFDPELWAHVASLAESNDWGKIPSQVVIFVEDCLRIWAGYPTDGRGDQLYGTNLFANILANDSELRLGSRASEYEGWRHVGMGLVQAVGNVDRHRIQQRSDAKKYAMGVLGMASLLLSQLRFEHGDLIAERQGKNRKA